MSKEDDMSMTEQSAIEAPAAKKPAPKKRRNAARKPVQAAAPKARDNLTGLTGSTCCADCGPEGCVISGINVCAHPRKGGLQGAQWATAPRSNVSTAPRNGSCARRTERRNPPVRPVKSTLQRITPENPDVVRCGVLGPR
jgi:hypothetical protein